MQLEYFQMVDRITDLDVGKRTITVESQVPETSTIFEGHFPGYPLMPGVLLTETMAQTSGWLLIALLKFERMPVPCQRQGSQDARLRKARRVADSRRKHRS